MQVFLVSVCLKQPRTLPQAKTLKTSKPTLVFWILSKIEVIYSLMLNVPKLTLLKRVQTIYVPDAFAS